mmetsp:Transcript_23124/g.48449  ORF Transcript_23124/g.48449 Transcript_23124/m.48449 type:complete len:821 (+) Transcript_23124:671-3133(+)
MREGIVEVVEQLLALHGGELRVGRAVVPRQRRHLLLLDEGARRAHRVALHHRQRHLLPVRTHLMPHVPAVGRRPGPLVLVPVLRPQPHLVEAAHGAEPLEEVVRRLRREQEHVVAPLLHQLLEGAYEVVLGGVAHLLLGPDHEVHVHEDQPHLARAVCRVHLSGLECVGGHLLVRRLDQPHPARRPALHVLPHVPHHVPQHLHVNEDGLHPPQHRVVPAPRQLLPVQVRPLVRRLSEALYDSAREVLIAPGVRPHDPRDNPAAGRELGEHELPLAPPHLCGEDVLEGDEAEAVPHGRIDERVRRREERAPRREGQLLLQQQHRVRVHLIDARGEGLDLLHVVHVHQLPPAVVERNRNLDEEGVVAVLGEEGEHALQRLELEGEARERLHVVVADEDDRLAEALEARAPRRLLLHHPVLPQPHRQRVRVDPHVRRPHVHVVPVEHQVQHPPPRRLVFEAEQGGARGQEVPRVRVAVELDAVRVEQRPKDLLADGEGAENLGGGEGRVEEEADVGRARTRPYERGGEHELEVEDEYAVAVVEVVHHRLHVLHVHRVVELPLGARRGGGGVGGGGRGVAAEGDGHVVRGGVHKVEHRLQHLVAEVLELRRDPGGEEHGYAVELGAQLLRQRLLLRGVHLDAEAPHVPHLASAAQLAEVLDDVEPVPRHAPHHPVLLRAGGVHAAHLLVRQERQPLELQPPRLGAAGGDEGQAVRHDVDGVRGLDLGRGVQAVQPRHLALALPCTHVPSPNRHQVLVEEARALHVKVAVLEHDVHALGREHAVRDPLPPHVAICLQNHVLVLDPLARRNHMRAGPHGVDGGVRG